MNFSDRFPVIKFNAIELVFKHMIKVTDTSVSPTLFHDQFIQIYSLLFLNYQLFCDRINQIRRKCFVCYILLILSLLFYY